MRLMFRADLQDRRDRAGSARHKNEKYVGTYEKPSRDRQEALSELEN
jgi:hypothetical protein